MPKPAFVALRLATPMTPIPRRCPLIQDHSRPFQIILFFWLGVVRESSYVVRIPNCSEVLHPPSHPPKPPPPPSGWPLDDGREVGPADGIKIVLLTKLSKELDKRFQNQAYEHLEAAGFRSWHTAQVRDQETKKVVASELKWGAEPRA